MATRIDLGLAPPARLGRLALHPAVREIRSDDGASEVVEPRMMQVLLALAEARGGIVRREELTERCWEGRVVGEDAINRVLSRLRRVAEGIGKGSFRIETITKIGYRLVELGNGAIADGGHAASRPETSPAVPDRGREPGRGLTRRTVLAGVAATGLALAGGGLWWRARRSPLPAPAREAMERGMAAFRMLTLDQLSTAAAFFRQACDLAPDEALPWGRLALAYRWMNQLTHGDTAGLNAQRARGAAHKALDLDPDNGDAQATLATLQPMFRNWTAYDAACRPILARHPDELGIGLLYLDLLMNVGRLRAATELGRRLLAVDPNWSVVHAWGVLSRWSLGQLDDADAAMDRAFRQWPRDIRVWFTRERFLAYSGRPAAALAMVEDEDNRPLGLPAWQFDVAAAEARALLTRSRTEIETAAGLYREQAHKSVGEAGNAAQFFAAVGRLDDAFAMLNALYFSRGFDVGERYFAEEEGVYSERRIRFTWLLWWPVMGNLRADPRMAAIVREMGLGDYWRRSGARPDFPIAGFPAA